MNIIDVRGLRMTYGTKVAVDGIDLQVDEGEILGILGPNGAGKTTTVECIAGLRRPDAGSISVAGHDPYLERAAVTPIMGVQLQQAGLQGKLTVREALELYTSFYAHPRDGLELVERLALAESLDVRYAKLSGGQQQRLAIALALIGRPRIALLDELSTGLDPRSRRDVWDLVDEARAGGTTVILVTHLMEEAHKLCDRLALVDRGRITALDTPDGLVARSAAPTIMAFTPSRTVDNSVLWDLPGVTDVRRHGDRIELSGDDDSVHATLGWLARHDIRAGRLRVTESTLDDAYLDLTGEPVLTEEN
ncbi:ABC transporter ATP-binding protein [Aeromicrobium sp. 9AM]|uniref:ABC transporter ATP-binding protein n=1 Tax=Aeromicrobium sp. 9AM TaxID=2653126 RepID=UPI0012F086BE|nr:ABC transporter ATP-binding protein [Aeromicrobium sp. 9AM]VXC41270.1 Multidrug ABC transporter ATP-binding protein [Aeromicrobium sp. 9AM]